MRFGRLYGRVDSLTDSTVRLAAPKGFLTIETIPKGPDGASQKMPAPLSPAYAAMSVDIARARLAAELLTLRARRLSAPFRLLRVFFLYLRVRQAAILAQAIAASTAAQNAAAQDRRASRPLGQETRLMQNSDPQR
jgi:hypothetical protein